LTPPPPWAGCSYILGAVAEFRRAETQTRHPRQVKLAWQMYDEKDERGKRKYTVRQIAEEFGVTGPTIYRHLAKATPST
jgi:DNA invertase Pin-like site-specific DNA recombinase